MPLGPVQAEGTPSDLGAAGAFCCCAALAGQSTTSSDPLADRGLSRGPAASAHRRRVAIGPGCRDRQFPRTGGAGAWEGVAQGRRKGLWLTGYPKRPGAGAVSSTGAFCPRTSHHPQQHATASQRPPATLGDIHQPFMSSSLYRAPSATTVHYGNSTLRYDTHYGRTLLYCTVRYSTQDFLDLKDAAALLGLAKLAVMPVLGTNGGPHAWGEGQLESPVPLQLHGAVITYCSTVVVTRQKAFNSHSHACLRCLLGSHSPGILLHSSCCWWMLLHALLDNSLARVVVAGPLASACTVTSAFPGRAKKGSLTTDRWLCADGAF
ncbi:hypothetical protein F5884DRAFT_871918 [Xylogone sp. PMI_703]|nr:hypothetical protein F5884DRAFT_871918 [Xylogone sp. PMI_703]